MSKRTIADESEWCMPQRTGTRRYLATLQELFWRYEAVQQRVDTAANCARRRYDNARRLAPFCSSGGSGRAVAAEEGDKGGQTTKGEVELLRLEKQKKRKERALCRLVRHYALYLSLYHIMTLSMTVLWNALLYCVRSIGDAPVPLPPTSENRKESAAEDYRQYVYARLHSNCKDGAAVAFDRLLNQVDAWLSLLDRQPTVASLEQKVRVDVVHWTRENVIETALHLRSDADRAWNVLLHYCDRTRIAPFLPLSSLNPSAPLEEARENEQDDECAQIALQRLTDATSGGDHIEMISRHSKPLAGARIQICLPPLAFSTVLKAAKNAKKEHGGEKEQERQEARRKQNIYEMDRLETALKAVGG